MSEYIENGIPANRVIVGWSSDGGWIPPHRTMLGWSSEGECFFGYAGTDDVVKCSTFFPTVIDIVRVMFQCALIPSLILRRLLDKPDGD